jgi:DNA-binding IclR family transcriptional regulator
MAVCKIDALNPLRYSVDLFQPMSIMWGATGRSVLAFLPESVVAELIEEAEPSPATGAPLPPAPKMMAELAQIRDRGYAITHGQKITDAVGIAAPVFAAGCQPVGSLCVTIPKYRFQPKMEPKIASVLVREADNLSKVYGCDVAPSEKKSQMPWRAA